MARFTPAGNPAGRFSTEQYEALDRVFAAAAPLTPGKVDALIRELGELDKYVQLNSLAAEKLTPSALSVKFHAIADAADKLLQKLGVIEDRPKQKKATEGWLKQVRDGLDYFAKQDAENAGGFPNYPPEITRFPLGDEEFIDTQFHQGLQLQQNIQGIFQIREWARRAEETTKLASRRVDKASKEAARAREEIVNSNMGKWSEVDICDKIFEIWVQILGRDLRTSVGSSGRVAEGPLVLFTNQCLELLWHERMTPDAIRARARRYCERSS